MYYAIMRISDGKFMPQYGSRKGRGGFTHDEPNDSVPPRLFVKKHQAESALKWWLDGRHYVIATEDNEDWRNTPVPSRNAEDMRIVAVTLQFALLEREK